MSVIGVVPLSVKVEEPKVNDLTFELFDSKLVQVMLLFAVSKEPLVRVIVLVEVYAPAKDQAPFTPSNVIATLLKLTPLVVMVLPDEVALNRMPAPVVPETLKLVAGIDIEP